MPQWDGLYHPAALVPSEDSVVSRATGPLRAAVEERGPYGPEQHASPWKSTVGRKAAEEALPRLSKAKWKLLRGSPV